MNVVFEQEALEEYRDAARYSQEHFGLGHDFIRAVRHATAAIAADPARFPQITKGIRVFRLRRFPFHLYYHSVEGSDRIIIYAVAHHARSPEYWRSRLP